MTETPNPHIVDADTMTGEMRPIRRAVLSMGSNLGERLANLQGGLSALVDTPEVTVVDVSPVYESEPVDAPDGSRDFLNLVVAVDTTLSPHTLLDRALAIEDAYGRARPVERNAPRTLDVDVVSVGDSKMSDDELVLPHPRAHLRRSCCGRGTTSTPRGSCPARAGWSTCSPTSKVRSRPAVTT